MCSQSWAVIWTKPNLETKAQTNIAKLGYFVFCPTYQKTIKHSRKAQIVPRPLFPRYIFTQNRDEGMSWYDINKCEGVCSIVMSNDQPAFLSHQIITDLRNRDPDKLNFPAWARIGKEVTVKDGPFKGFTGKITDLDDRDRVRLLLSLLGRSVSVEAPFDHIGPL